MRTPQIPSMAGMTSLGVKPENSKATVRQSRDPQWRKWAVIYPDKQTQWFDSENQALLAMDDYNESKSES